MNTIFNTHLETPPVELPSADGLSIAVIGPDNLLRSAAAKALIGCHKGEVREFSSYPPCLGDLPQLLDQHHDIVMIELDSNPDYALDLVEGICASGMSTVMVYSKDADPDLTDPDLLMRCMRAGAREFLSMPFGDKSLTEALTRAAARRPSTRVEKKGGGRLLVFCGAKGGAGVTAIACNFAIALASESSESTLLIDLDLPMGDAALNLGIVADYSTIDALQNINRLDSAFLSKLVIKHSSAITVLASPGNVSPFQPTNEGIDRLLTIARQDFKNVVVDVGSKLDLMGSMAPFNDADMFYLVTQTGIPELRNANRLISQYFHNDGLKLEIVLNRFESRGIKISEENITKALTRPAKWKIPNDYAAIRKMQDTALPVALTDSLISRQIVQMARAVCGLPEIPEKKKGFSLKGLSLGMSSKSSSFEEPADILQLQLVTGPANNGHSPKERLDFLSSSEDVPVKTEKTEKVEKAEEIPQEVEEVHVDSADMETPIIEWTAPEPISSGTPLDETQFNATSSVLGTFTYTPSKGFMLPAGTHTLWTTFTPSRSAGAYRTVQAFVPLLVNKAVPIIAWPTPSAIFCGTALGADQLNATASVPGSFIYNPSEGFVPAAGAQTLSVTFTPNDTHNYSSAEAHIELMVAKSAPKIVWPTPAPIAYGTVLSAAQLNATASIPGAFTYTPGEGEILSAGTHNISLVFTPADPSKHTGAESEISLTVTKAKPVVTWHTPDAITFGSALSDAELSATASVAGTFEYSPGKGSILSAGRHTPVAVFTPADSANFVPVQVAAPIDVAKVSPTISWPAPNSIQYGTALSAEELNATASVPGTFTYSPAAGSMLPVGSQTLTVTFTPIDSTNYTTAQATTTLTVAKATPIELTWLAPAALTYGDKLTKTQLNATASVPGVFSYSPAEGEVLTAGNHALTVTFTPADSSFTPSQASVDLIINKAKPSIVWSNPSPITHGTELGHQQLNATASVPGTFSYAPAAGEIPVPGTISLSVTFTPADTANYTSVEAHASLIVAKASPVITWSAPEPISYGTPLSATQLNAVASVPGVFKYVPVAGTVFTAGTHTISASFVPADTRQFETVQAWVPLVVLLTNIALPIDPIEPETPISLEPTEEKSFAWPAMPQSVSPDRVRSIEDMFKAGDSFVGRALPEGVETPHASSAPSFFPDVTREPWQAAELDESELNTKSFLLNGSYLRDDSK